MSIKYHPIEIFCGTGGVGKTTMATSRALFLAEQGKKVLLITIDPAKRLKEVLKMDENSMGEIQTVSSQIFSLALKGEDSFEFDALLMSPKATMDRIGIKNKTTKDLDNPIINVLTRPYGGLNEILSIVELQSNYEQNNYDSIILDTPPGKHFIDFLESSQKIKKFFDKSFIDVFRYLGRSKEIEDTEKKGILSLIVKTGIKKLLSYLEKVTGVKFVENFIEAILSLFKNRKSFIKALEFHECMKNDQQTKLFLVTSVDHNKFNEASDLRDKVDTLTRNNTALLVNKCLSSQLESWDPNENIQLRLLRDTMLERENELKKSSKNKFSRVNFFKQSFSQEPLDHVCSLYQEWHDFDKERS